MLRILACRHRRGTDVIGHVAISHLARRANHGLPVAHAATPLPPFCRPRAHLIRILHRILATPHLMSGSLIWNLPVPCSVPGDARHLECARERYRWTKSCYAVIGLGRERPPYRQHKRAEVNLCKPARRSCGGLGTSVRALPAAVGCSTYVSKIANYHTAAVLTHCRYPEPTLPRPACQESARRPP